MSTNRINKSLPKDEKAVSEANKTFSVEFMTDNLKALCKLAEMKQKKLKEYKPNLETVPEESRRNKP